MAKKKKKRKHREQEEAAKAQDPAAIIHKRMAWLRGHHPVAVARIHLLTVLARLQHILNIRRVGQVDVNALVAALEVYEMGDIRQGIVWIPLDHITWIGTTNEPIGAERIGLESHAASDYSPQRSVYERVRRELAGLAQPEPEASA